MASTQISYESLHKDGNLDKFISQLQDLHKERIPANLAGDTSKFKTVTVCNLSISPDIADTVLEEAINFRNSLESFTRLEVTATIEGIKTEFEVIITALEHDKTSLVVPVEYSSIIEKALNQEGIRFTRAKAMNNSGTGKVLNTELTCRCELSNAESMLHSIK